jgi:hypothetical protein
VWERGKQWPMLFTVHLYGTGRRDALHVFGSNRAIWVKIVIMWAFVKVQHDDHLTSEPGGRGHLLWLGDSN